MSSLNKVMLIGNLGRDPDVRATQSGTKVCNLALATTERWKSDGERKERTEWHRVVIFGNLAEIAEKYLKKGSKVYLAGQLQTRKWSDSNGVEKYSTEVVLNPHHGEMVLLDSKDDTPPPRAVTPSKPAPRRAPDLDDDIPF